MKISIITVCKDSIETINECIDSVLSQNYTNLEYIIVDGDSSDGTLDIINNRGQDISRYISEKDSGIYDAMNKGISLATGDVVGFLNSDDLYAGPDILKIVAEAFVNNDIDSCYGDLQYVSKNNTDKIIRYWKSCEFNYELFKSGWHPPHPTFFVRRTIYNKFGSFDTKYKIGADYALMLKLLLKHRITTSYIPTVMVKMRAGGDSNRSFINIFRANIECYRAWKQYDLNISPLFIFKKPLSKLFQYINL